MVNGTTEAINGSESQMLASLDGATSWLHVTELTTESMDGTADRIGADSHDSRKRKQYIGGQSGEDITIACNNVPSSAGQQLLEDVYFGRVGAGDKTVYLKTLIQPKVGAVKYTSKCVVTKWGRSGANNTPQPFSMSFSVTGDLTRDLATLDDLTPLPPIVTD